MKFKGDSRLILILACGLFAASSNGDLRADELDASICPGGQGQKVAYVPDAFGSVQVVTKSFTEKEKGELSKILKILNGVGAVGSGVVKSVDRFIPGSSALRAAGGTKTTLDRIGVVTVGSTSSADELGPKVSRQNCMVLLLAKSDKCVDCVAVVSDVPRPPCSGGLCDYGSQCTLYRCDAHSQPLGITVDEIFGTPTVDCPGTTKTNAKVTSRLAIRAYSKQEVAGALNDAGAACLAKLPTPVCSGGCAVAGGGIAHTGVSLTQYKGASQAKILRVTEYNAPAVQSAVPPAYFSEQSQAALGLGLIVGVCSRNWSCERAPTVCGDGKMEGTEACDSGTANGVVCLPNGGPDCTYCSKDCRVVVQKTAGCGAGLPLCSTKSLKAGNCNNCCQGPGSPPPYPCGP